MTLRKIILSILILYILYLIYAWIGFGGGCGTMKPETHLIPNGYVGEIRIIFNSEDGKKKETEGSARIYSIDNDGILKTKFSPNTGWFGGPEDLKFFYLDNGSGQRTKLIRIDPLDKKVFENMDSNSVVIREFGYHNLSYGDDPSFTTLIYQIDTFKNFKHYYIDSLRQN